MFRFIVSITTQPSNYNNIEVRVYLEKYFNNLFQRIVLRFNQLQVIKIIYQRNLVTVNFHFIALENSKQF